MTNTERIALFLGWRKQDVSPWVGGHAYQKGSLTVCVNPTNGKGPHGTWPDFTTLDGCREFEDALFEKGLWYQYAKELYFQMLDYELTGVSHTLAFSCLRATTAQRVAACIAVLDEAWL